MRCQYLLGIVVLVGSGLGPAARGGEGKPTKAAAIKLLKDFHAALEAKDFDKAVTFLYVPEKYRKELPKFKDALKGLADTKEITKDGLAVLAKRGKWGKLNEVVDEAEAKRLTKRSGLSPESCYGLFAEPRRGAAFTWNGKRLLIIYFNNIGALETDSK